MSPWFECYFVSFRINASKVYIFKDIIMKKSYFYDHGTCIGPFYVRGWRVRSSNPDAISETSATVGNERASWGYVKIRYDPNGAWGEGSMLYAVLHIACM